MKGRSVSALFVFQGDGMAIPDFQTLMLPLMRLVEDGQPHSMREATAAIGAQFFVSDAEWAEMLPSGRAPLFYNRLAWAKTYLKRAGLIEQPGRGVITISNSGKHVLSLNPSKIDLQLLQKQPGFIQNKESEEPANGPTPAITTRINEQSAIATPEETMERSHLQLRQELTTDVLDSVKRCPPVFFERLVVQLLIKMGYGGSREEAGRAVGKSGDGGIDGIINEDRLGLDAIYLQAKRWEGVVGRPEIMKFVGALAGQRANKGVFITTSWYTQEARDYAGNSQYKVVLIDGPRLADLMIEHDLGVSVAATYQLKRIDSDFFADE
jgi:restriction system protein